MTWKGRARSISSRGCPSDEFITWRSPTGRDQELLAGQGSQGACALAAAFPVRVSLFRIGVIPGRDTASQSRESAHGNSQLKFRVHRVSVLEPDGSTTERERERERELDLHRSARNQKIRKDLGIALRHALQSHR
jgi:hypothetical protein